MAVVVVAILHPKAEHRDEVRDALVSLIPKVHQEDGCELYSLQENADNFVFVEQWTSQEALRAHGGGPVLVEMNALLEGKMAKPATLHITSPVPAGDPRKGIVRP
ncbi:putative quinol monooxygenase [Fodinicola acaciae]|uniref:putative quinol monooxygenase n=1 Tax=Fodinicola acaciae TaxID=2681555 RepID=UPI0013D3019A|nr:putative quinol monooxygenase [Fodinicola acaciae]